MTTLEVRRADSGRRQPILIAISQVAALSCWFSASAVAPDLEVVLDTGAQGSALLAIAVQLGFVGGALGSSIINLPDRVRPTMLYALGAVGSAGCTMLIALVARDLSVAIALRFGTGMALAVVYPVGLQLMASWAAPAQRARALGLLVGALTVGSATPQLIRGTGGLSWQGVLLTAAAITLLGGLVMALFVTPGPRRDRQPVEFDARYAIAMFRSRGPRLANLGYLGHMWELYAFWTWLPVFILHSQIQSRGDQGSVVYLVAFLTIGAAGFVGCLVGGYAADRIGRAPSAVTALVISGACCLLSPLFF
jgi:predicted MFS family arabinose efflux permease